VNRLRSLFSSVRYKLLLLVLLPPLVILPAVVGLVIYWGNNSYDRLLVYKVNAELVIAHQYLERVLESNRRVVDGLAASALLARARHDGARVHVLFEQTAQREKFDFLHLLDPKGKLVATSTRKPPGDRHDFWPVVQAAMAGRSQVALDIFSPEQLGALDEELRSRARIPVISTPNAAPDNKTEEARGMMIHAAAPVFDEHNRLVAIVQGGVLLNRNLDFVDNINSIVYTEGTLPLDSKGTATLFLDDVRIATNVRLFGGERALGTRVSLAVRDAVLGEGRTWLDSAFVVNDWYVSGYEPIHDSFGRRVGMLYVGYLERPFRQVKRNILTSMVALFGVITLIGSIISLRRARAIFRPLERMDATMDAVEGGDATARVGTVAGEDEIARLAQHFDRLLDTLENRNAELRKLNAELDQKVIERTRELAQALEELRAAQKHLVRSEKLAAIGQLTAGVAHEINNPIAVMQGNLDVMRELLGPAAAPVDKEMRLLDEQVNRVRVIVTKLLQFARPDEFAGYIETVDVNAVVADSLVLVRHELKKSDIRVLQELHASRSVRLNRNELQQVLINLIVNAVHAMETGGTLTLATEDWEERGVRIGVRDTGSGIPPENLSRIFDPFFTTKRTQGTGLGLSISLALIERYGGTITVDSQVGEGTVFTVFLLCEPVFSEKEALKIFGAAEHAERMESL
jgi:two-component system NtrC family sensor kinase